MFPPYPTTSASSTLCTCCASSHFPSTPEVSESTEPPLLVTTSEFSIKLKEIIILSLIFILLLYSVITFLNKWSKSYRQINQIPYYSADQTEELSPGMKSNLICNYNIPIKVLPPVPWDEDDISRAESRMSRVVRVRIILVL